MADYQKRNTKVTTTHTRPFAHLPLLPLQGQYLYLPTSMCSESPILSSPFHSSDWSQFPPNLLVTDTSLSFQPLQHPSEPNCHPEDRGTTFLQNTAAFNHHIAQKFTRRTVTAKQVLIACLQCAFPNKAKLQYTRWFKYDRDWFVCKQAALRSSWATLREWSHNLHPPSCSG